MIECKGAGDPTGETQKEYFKHKATTKFYQKLPLAPIFKATCETKGTQAAFQGDVGSVYLVECPEGYDSLFVMQDA